MSITIQLKRSTSQELAESNPILAAGEPCLELDTGLVKYGDGATPWNDLEYSFGGQPIGSNNVMSNEFCAVFGLDAKSSTFAQTSFSGGKFATTGDAQYSVYHLRQKTVTDSPKEMFLDGISKRLFIEVGMTWNFDIKLTAHNFNDGTTAVWNIRGGIERMFSDEEAKLIGQPTIENCGQSWSLDSDIEVVAANNALTIRVSGLNNKTIYWYATVSASEIQTPGILKPIPRPANAVAASLLLKFDNSPPIDSSDTPLTVTNNGVAINYNNPKYGDGSGYFNGANASLVVTVPGSQLALTGDFTIECWAYIQSREGEYLNNIIGSNSSAWPATDMAFFRVWGCCGMNGKLALGNPSHDVNPGHRSSGDVPMDTWVHLCATRQAGIIRLFINGLLSYTSSEDTTTYNFGYGGSMRVGNTGWDPDSSGLFYGNIDDLRIVKGLAVYTSNFTPPQSALLPYAVAQNLPPIPPSETNFIDVTAPSTVTTLNVTCGSNQMYPTFNPAITDYYVRTNQISNNASISYGLNINGADTTGTASPNKCLRISNTYHIRFLPADIYTPTVSIAPQNGYVPGWYLTGRDGYFAIYSEYGVPVWYMKYTQNSPFSLHKGSDSNRVVLNFPSGSRCSVQITSDANLLKNYNLVGGYSWDIHDAQEVATPGPRKGNMMGLVYLNGFYLQEMDQSNQKVWEWFSSEYFNANGNPEYFHTNSVDINAVTGNILISSRHTGTVMCIDFSTKQVLWVLQGQPYLSGTAQAIAIPNTTANTKWLVPYNEPIVAGFQYQGPRGNHDARWHPEIAPLTPGNEVFSVYDDQSGNNSRARGVIYEVDLANNRAIFRSHVYHDSGVSGYMGSYTVVKEADNTFTHTVNYVQQHPSMVEYAGDTNGNGSQTKTLALDFSGDNYRLIKVRRDFFNIDYLRNTAGTQPVTQ